jgi:signal transduction histidine kinase
MTNSARSSGPTVSIVAGPRIEFLRGGPCDSAWNVGVVHDLGNLIQVAASAVSLIKRSSSAGKVADLAPLVAGAATALERAGAIVRQTIAVAQSGSPVLEHVNLTDCLAEVGDLVQPMLNANIRLHVRTDSDGLAVTANRLELQNALLNLVFNAREAMPGGGVVSIFARESYDRASGSDIEIRVADTGVGMTPDLISRVFDPYFTTKANGIGGVGLPMVKRFAEEAGGSLQIASAPGSGTTVTLRLPAATALSAALASVLNSAQPANAGGNVQG